VFSIPRAAREDPVLVLNSAAGQLLTFLAWAHMRVTIRLCFHYAKSGVTATGLSLSHTHAHCFKANGTMYSEL
jgi:hypothetical protein